MKEALFTTFSIDEEPMPTEPTETEGGEEGGMNVPATEPESRFDDGEQAGSENTDSDAEAKLQDPEEAGEAA